MGHSILFKQCGSDRMTRRRSHAIDRIVIRYTATLASARNNAIYCSHNERQGSSARYFVGDITDEIYQSVAEGDTAWHAGNWLMNCRSVGIEAVSASEDYSEVEAGKLAWRGRRHPPLRRDRQDLPRALHRRRAQGGPAPAHLPRRRVFGHRGCGVFRQWRLCALG